jgi:cell division protein FtsL
MKAKIKLRNMVTTVCLIFSFFLFPIFAVWKKAQVIQAIKANEILRRQKQDLVNENIVYQYELQRLKSRARIEAAASKDLALAYPEGRDVVVLEKGADRASKGIARWLKDRR